MFKFTRPRILSLIIIAIFLLLFMHLFKLQIIEGAKYEQIATNNIVRIKNIPPVRGEIFDARYRPIAVNKPSLNLYLTPGLIKDRDQTSNFISENFSMTCEEVQKIIHDNRYRLYQDILIIQNVTYEEVVKTSEKLNYYPSLSYKTEAIRQYEYNNHFTGHTGRINEREYAQLKREGYTINSLLGKSGLEKNYENLLRGKNGKEVIQVDASGQNLLFFKENMDIPPENGADLILTINNDLQIFINTILPEKARGAVIVMNAETGGILAYVSKPDFDLNIFGSNISQKDWEKLINDPAKPMMDRIIHGTYPPASVYKTVPAALALESGLIAANTKLANCEGGMLVGNRFYKCWYEKGHGQLNVSDAIKVSCDVFFYDLSLKLTLEEMKDYTQKNMLTTLTEIDLPGERKGFFPEQKWYEENYGKNVGVIGHKVNLVIGQGEILTTPLQICAYFAAISNDGKWIQPHLLSKSIKGDLSVEFTPKKKTLPISNENIMIIKEALWNTVNQRYGTGIAAQVAGVNVAGKTGSAENHMGEDTHSWFAGYASANDFEIAFVVFLENAGGGGTVSAPISAQIIDYYQRMEK